MPLLEVFIHQGCRSERRALDVVQDLGDSIPALQVTVAFEQNNRERMSELDLVVLPAFVLDGTVFAVGVPKKKWLIREITTMLSHEGRGDFRSPETPSWPLVEGNSP